MDGIWIGRWDIDLHHSRVHWESKGRDGDYIAVYSARVEKCSSGERVEL